MTKQTISIACDHAGVEMKKEVSEYLKEQGFTLIDHGTDSSESVDYPDFAALVAIDIQDKKCDLGIIVCGTGVGMAITANKFNGVRAASLTDIYVTEMSRKHNDLNVLCLGSRVLGAGKAIRIVEAFLKTAFEGGRHARRVEKIGKYEQ